MKYILDEAYDKDGKTAASKPKLDVDNILKSEGYQLKILPYVYGGSIKELLEKFINEYKDLKYFLMNLKQDDLVFIQHPLVGYSTQLGKVIRKYKKKNGFKSIILIHDLDDLRNNKIFGVIKKGKISNLFRDEIYYLDSFDGIIAHNSKMKRYLVSKGIASKKIVELGIFDYIVNDSNMYKTNKPNNSVTIAGNLERDKAGYVYELDKLRSKNYCLELYGINYDGNNSDFIHYNGSFKPEELQAEITAGYGLIWDGTDIDTCEGEKGKYLRFNNPHKLSLYMTCGIPVISWSHAAIGDFIKENNIGITIDSLRELDEYFENFNEEEYLQYKKNVLNIRSRVINGDNLKDALSKLNIK